MWKWTVATLVLVAVLLLTIQAMTPPRSPKVVMWFKCSTPSCGKLFSGEYRDKFPFECSSCQNDTVLCARECLVCEAIFGADGWWSRSYTCPTCGTTRNERYGG